MYIISKDHKQIVNGDSIDRVYAKKNWIMVEYQNGKRKTVSEYETIEDAETVMEMLTESAQACLTVWELPPAEVLPAYRNEQRLQAEAENDSSES